jgi:hypothetical protein
MFVCEILIELVIAIQNQNTNKLRVLTCKCSMVHSQINRGINNVTKDQRVPKAYKCKIALFF